MPASSRSRELAPSAATSRRAAVLAPSGMFFFFSSRRRHTRLQGDWSQTCALPIFHRDYPAADDFRDNRDECEDDAEDNQPGASARRREVHLQTERDEEDGCEDSPEVARALCEVLSKRGAPEQAAGEERSDNRGKPDHFRDERVQEGDGHRDDETAMLESELHPLHLDANNHLPEEIEADGHPDTEERQGGAHEDAQR